MGWPRLRRRFFRLYWRLALSYLVATLVAVLLLVALFLWAIDAYASEGMRTSHTLAAQATAEAPRLLPFLEASPPDIDGLCHLLMDEIGEPYTSERDTVAPFRINLYVTMPPWMYVAVTDPRGVVLTCAPGGTWQMGRALAPQLPGREAGLVTSALGGKSASWIAHQRPRGTVSSVAVPLHGRGGQLRGTLFVRHRVPYEMGDVLPVALQFVGQFAVLLLAITGIAGAGIGLLITRHLTRRLSRMADAADAWGRGEFGASAGDPTADELGELSQRLDAMAHELQQLVSLQQELAASRERNRLAQDLHDTVKQQVFASVMLMGTALSLMEHDAAAARSALSEAERLGTQVQHDLTAIVRQLRSEQSPAIGPKTELDRFIADWARQTGVRTVTDLQPLADLGQPVCQVLLRIVQGALSNVARHSRASYVRVALEPGPDARMRLVISDDGCGFDAAHITAGEGLAIMRERAQSLPGGVLRVDSRVGGPTRVEVVFLPEGRG